MSPVNHPTPRPFLALAAAAVSGAVRALVGWLLERTVG
ncbi:hypothetical protein SBI_03885 [Streptomyces bingchenggensis BCW-1]|uniref:Uncharacterized protein n=1 Tax=Streptomyces bingchenggensis (strain BCW-1) TaxID=749414 RepID=D7CHE9_STRBB|nr:hypothetical protein SBI_03885 [Streptomyces bingchenggensis BCW-1]